MNNLSDIVLRIHMTFLSNKHSVEWITSFEEEIRPLSEKEFEDLIGMLEGVSEAEHANFMESLMYNTVPNHLRSRAADPSNFNALIEQLKIEYTRWKS